MEIPTSPEDAYPKIIEFFRSNGGIFSPDDNQESIKLHEEKVEALMEKGPRTWGDYNKKMRDILVLNYVNAVKEAMGLNRQQVNDLKQTIHIGIITGILTKENIIVNDSFIESIDGLEFIDGKFVTPKLGKGGKVIKTTKTAKVAKPSSKNKEKKILPCPGTPEWENVIRYEQDIIPKFSLRWRNYLIELNKRFEQNYKSYKDNKNNKDKDGNKDDGDTEDGNNSTRVDDDDDTDPYQDWDDPEMTGGTMDSYE